MSNTRSSILWIGARRTRAAADDQKDAHRSSLDDGYRAVLPIDTDWFCFGYGK